MVKDRFPAIAWFTPVASVVANHKFHLRFFLQTASCLVAYENKKAVVSV